jgi:anthraniloyl-CoA monooxygenase
MGTGGNTKRLTRIAVLGGGPGGLYAARLLKLGHPAARVDVYEQGSPDKTFGFGVGLATRTQRNLHEADPVSFEAISSAAYPHEMSMQVDGQVARLRDGKLLAIARTTLLAVLRASAEQAGVRLHFGVRRAVGTIDADLIVAADGAGSATRARFAADFRPEIETGAGLYLWCGTDFALPAALFTPVTTDHGTFVAHAYPYAPDRSTFLVETDATTWRNAGFDVTTERTPTAGSDEASLRYLERAFAGALEGHRLIGNRTRWLRFRTVTCGSWHRGNVVLLGDAAHTAHYSIGSGTKLAMEDAIALGVAVREAADLDGALAAYERNRRPAVAHLQEIARRSEVWWESFPERMHLPVDQLMLAYMTRSGKVDVERFVTAAPAVARRGLAAYAGLSDTAVPARDVAEWILAQPLTHDGRTHPRRIADGDLRDAPTTAIVEVDIESAWGPSADAVVAAAPATTTLWLTGSPGRTALLLRLDLAERLCRATRSLVVVEGSRRDIGDLAAGLASARTHLVAVTHEVPA